MTIDWSAWLDIIKVVLASGALGGGIWKGAQVLSEGLKLRADANLEARRLDQQIYHENTKQALEAMGRTIKAQEQRIDNLRADLNEDRRERANLSEQLEVERGQRREIEVKLARAVADFRDEKRLREAGDALIVELRGEIVILRGELTERDTQIVALQAQLDLLSGRMRAVERKTGPLDPGKVRQE